MDRLPALIVIALFTVVLRPTITEVGISGGPYWPEIGERETFDAGARAGNRIRPWGVATDRARP